MNSKTNNFSLERLAFACLVGLLAGIIMARSGAKGLDYSLLVWILSVLFSGVILEQAAQSRVARLVVNSALWSITPVVGAAGYIFTRYLASGILDFPAGAITFSGVHMGPVQLQRAFPLMVVMGVILYVASFILLALSTTCGALLVKGSVALFHAGPESVEKVRKIVIAITGLIAAVIALWFAVG